MLDNQELLEGFALEAFEQAAAANLPAVFSDATYRKRPELLEGGVNAAWVMLPRAPAALQALLADVQREDHAAHGGSDRELRGRAARPSISRTSWESRKGEAVEAEVHLFEVLPGGTRGRHRAQRDGNTGARRSRRGAVSQLHPLTNEAAGVLLGKPGLGRGCRPARTCAGWRPGNASITWRSGGGH